MRRIWEALLGPLPFRVVVALVLVAALLVALHFFYTWAGDTFLDTGGGIG